MVRESEKHNLVCLSIVILLIAIIAGSVSYYNNTKAYELPNPAKNTSVPIRIDYLQFSKDNATVGDVIDVTFTLQNLVNGNMTISNSTIFERTVSNYSQLYTQPTSNATFILLSSEKWQIVNATHSLSDRFILYAGQNLPFHFQLKAIDTGIYYLYPAFQWSFISANGQMQNGMEYGNGWKVDVHPTQDQLKECQKLGISENDCTVRELAQKTIIYPKVVSDNGTPVPRSNPIDKMIYLVGIGAAIAGAVAFLTLRKLKK